LERSSFRVEALQTDFGLNDGRQNLVDLLDSEIQSVLNVLLLADIEVVVQLLFLPGVRSLSGETGAAVSRRGHDGGTKERDESRANDD
jgi:hypothetical protein